MLSSKTQKTRVTVAGKRVRVIEGLKLRLSYDNDLTVEEILAQKRGDNPKDNYAPTHAPTPETLSDKSGDNLDNFWENKKENKNTLVVSQEKSEIERVNQVSIESQRKENLVSVNEEVEPLLVENEDDLKSLGSEQSLMEVENKNLINKVDSVSGVVPTSTGQEIEAILPVVPQVVPQVVPPLINWKTYPYNSRDIDTIKNRANKVVRFVEAAKL
ncbi:hypothetical protein H1P_6170001 [Hyella patelloides LEGE 07179]|uniref:Uncharacterized protein n=1 Tax=Hyella patelloides LEGE 07179 TaxID=945734 RepID=A0A563W1C1_9CYAN|nr:hypothetical protein [Hyella patelloides]VEP17488.1 hypothetical protein H1P_6170001 [Hyella patelloides LEGE 07179]